MCRPVFVGIHCMCPPYRIMFLVEDNLPKRKPIRLDTWDYANSWWYFVTIVVQNRKHLFGSVPVGAGHAPPAMVLNNVGKIVERVYREIPNHYPVRSVIHQIMPNHIHFIIETVGATHVSPANNTTGGACPAPTLGNIIGSFKSECTKQIRMQTNNPTLTVWQRGYYDRIIRNDRELDRIRTYIQNNPQNWADDEYHT